MVKIDLITGFLGSGKTTFLKKYTARLLERGQKVGILENDYGAVNVDMMLLSELDGESCMIETVAGACDYDCHKRRFKTKLIALGMSGLDRVIVEPSGIFDVDEFFDTLHEEPLDRWYEIGSVITIVDALDDSPLPDYACYLLAAQAADAGAVVFSKTALCTPRQIEEKLSQLNGALKAAGCEEQPRDRIFTQDWEHLSGETLDIIADSGYRTCGFSKLPPDESGFETLYFMNTELKPSDAQRTVGRLFDGSCGDVFRVKGFIRGDGWYELNATANQFRLAPIGNGQDIIIVIGENLDKSRISEII